MLKSYLYINFGKPIGKDTILKEFKEILWFETALEVGDDYLLSTFDVEDGGTARTFTRHILMQDDDWILSSSYKLLEKLYCLETGFVILGELVEVTDKKVTFLDNVFKLGTDLILKMSEQDDIDFVKSNIRKDRKIESIGKQVIDGVEHTNFRLDKPILVQLVGDITDSYVEKLKSLKFLGGQNEDSF